MEANNGVAGMDRAGVGDEERGQCESMYSSREEKEMICTLTPSFREEKEMICTLTPSSLVSERKKK